MTLATSPRGKARRTGCAQKDVILAVEFYREGSSTAQEFDRRIDRLGVKRDEVEG